ncbi:iron chelate uptake ABC transporter family permease subunit [Mariniluteicoccus flavus]
MTAVLQPTRQSTARATRPARPGVRLAVLGFLALASIAAFYLIGANGNLDFVLAFRTRKVVALVLVAVAVAVSTVLFHTVTTNHILTPSIMGFDALYALLQTSLVFVWGASGLAKLSPPVAFVVNTVAMMTLATFLFSWLFGRMGRSIHVLVLVGLVLGTLLRSGSALLQRIMDPNAFLVLQSKLFASFNAVDQRLLAIGGVMVIATVAWVWTRRRELDVVALGSDLATTLGVNHRRAVLLALLATSLLVSVSTSLVGPITFFGLLVANLAYAVLGTHRHAYTLPGAALAAIICLVGGQAILEHVLDMGTVLSVIIELIGGLVLIVLLVRPRKT